MMEVNEKKLREYKHFVTERHKIWERRREDPFASSWTDDPILDTKKFCNVFRVLDAGTQYLLRGLLYNDDASFATLAMRSFGYRYTNRPEAWLHFAEVHGRAPEIRDLENGELLKWTWRKYFEDGKPVFGNAYKMFVGRENAGEGRLDWVLRLMKEYFTESSPFNEHFNIVRELGMAETVHERLIALKFIPRCGNFMGMQIATDIGYTDDVQADENEFIAAGPGAIAGAALIAPRYKAEEVIAGLQEVLWEDEKCPLLPVPGGFRKPSLMDIQNTLCEYGKYHRWTLTGPARWPYARRAANPGPQPDPFIPPHWAIN